MLKKLTVLPLILLFAWNAIFAASGGMLLCLHEDFSVHIDNPDAGIIHCESEHVDCERVLNRETHCSSCLDVEISGSELPHMLINDHQFLTSPDSGEVVLVSDFLAGLRSSFGGNAFKGFESNPPDLEALNLRIARTIILRL